MQVEVEVEMKQGGKVESVVSVEPCLRKIWLE